MTSRKLSVSQQQWEMCAERGSGILQQLAKAARCGRGTWVLQGALPQGSQAGLLT